MMYKPTVNSNDFNIIPIKIIKLQKRVVNQLKKHNWDGDYNQFKVESDTGVVGELMRMDDMMNAMRDLRELPPIVIKKIELYTPPHINVPKYKYTIWDGAHRIAASILMGYDVIPVVYI